MLKIRKARHQRPDILHLSHLVQFSLGYSRNAKLQAKVVELTSMCGLELLKSSKILQNKSVLLFNTRTKAK